MKTLKELKQAAENKGLRHEVNKWDPTIHRWETDNAKRKTTTSRSRIY